MGNVIDKGEFVGFGIAEQFFGVGVFGEIFDFAIFHSVFQKTDVVGFWQKKKSAVFVGGGIEKAFAQNAGVRALDGLLRSFDGGGRLCLGCVKGKRRGLERDKQREKEEYT